MATVRGRIESISLNGSPLPPAMFSQQRGSRSRARENTIEYPKTTDVQNIGGLFYVVETWLFEFPDGEFDFLQRRHLVTDPAQIEALSV